MGSIGFKEWALVCEALGRGEQSILIRKGGIAEGRKGFAFKHREFFLFPTFFHEQVEKVRALGAVLPQPPERQVEIRFFAKMEASRVITSWDTAAALEPLHILAAEVVRERFGYDEAPGVRVAFVRVFRLRSPWRFADERRFGGCRSWLQLPDAPRDAVLEPVLSDIEHAKRAVQFEEVTGAATASGHASASM